MINKGKAPWHTTALSSLRLFNTQRQLWLSLLKRLLEEFFPELLELFELLELLERLLLELLDELLLLELEELELLDWLLDA
ncbi:MAG: hypothetical protein IJ052_07790 [Oscillospiraceae bacterium]|nr:hypothetical protein [Oscillospiraceae bacterium]